MRKDILYVGLFIDSRLPIHTLCATFFFRSAENVPVPLEEAHEAALSLNTHALSVMKGP